MSWNCFWPELQTGELRPRHGILLKKQKLIIDFGMLPASLHSVVLAREQMFTGVDKGNSHHDESYA